jgi:hypothetical protein
MPRGRLSIFPKDGPKVQGFLSTEGARLFERARHELTILAGWQGRTVSDADTIEFLARGQQNTLTYLQRRSKMADQKPTRETKEPPKGEKVPGTGNRESGSGPHGTNPKGPQSR